MKNTDDDVIADLAFIVGWLTVTLLSFCTTLALVVTAFATPVDWIQFTVTVLASVVTAFITAYASMLMLPRLITLLLDIWNGD